MNETVPGSPKTVPPAAGAADPSPLGPVAQYHSSHATIFRDEVTITGATADDPSGSKTRQPVRVGGDPDWANPLSGFKAAFRDYSVSFLLFWFTYGAALALGILAVGFFSGEYAMFGALTLPFFAAPVYGLFMDYAIVLSNSAYAVFGIAFLCGEVLLGLFFLFTHDWRERWKYVALTVAFAWFQIIIFVLGGLGR